MIAPPTSVRHRGDSPNRSGGPRTRTAASALLALALTIPAASIAGDPEIRLDSGRLWIESGGEIIVGDLLGSVAAETGVEFLLDPGLAPERMRIAIEGVELERALRILIDAVPGAGGLAMSHVPDASGTPRVSRVTVFAAGKPSAATAPEGGREPDLAGMAVIPPPAPSDGDLQSQKEHMIATGLPPETAQRYIDLMTEARRIEKTGAEPSERFRASRDRLMREMAEARKETLEIDAAREKGTLPPPRPR